ncbi:hypothetical protein VNO77_27410 [Canavalia gladiata]|uniref:PRLI-interacting factor A n=1 Tax=Canavalia gladiata TaxID=3824 RepID=A0AAN9KX76_CANGL
MAHSQIFHGHQNYVVWPHPVPPYPPENASMFPCSPAFNSYPGRVNRKGNKFHRTGSEYGFKPGKPNPPDMHLPATNRSGVKARRFHQPKRKFSGGGVRPEVPLAPRNTSSFLLRAKRCGGIALPSMPTPSPPMSPATLEVEVEMAKVQWGFDAYGSMKGILRLRRELHDSDEDPGEDSGAGSFSVPIVEKRLALSRFEIVNPNSGEEHKLENRVDEQDTHIAQLEEENLTLKERIFLMERELGELRRRVMSLETDGIGAAAYDAGELEIFAVANDNCSEKSVGNNNSGSDHSNNSNSNHA